VAGGVVGALLVGSLSAWAAADVTRAAAPSAAADAEVFVSLSPTRVFDTRVPIGTAAAGPLMGGRQVDLPLTGPALNRSSTPLPPDATAVVVNVTIDQDASEKAFLTIWPTGEPRPNTSVNNAEPGVVTPNETMARLGGNGSISIYLQQGSANVAIDVTGYLRPGAPPTAYSFGTDHAGVSLAPFASASLTGEFGYGPEQPIYTLPALPSGDYLLSASVSFSKLPDGLGGLQGAQNDMSPQCWWSTTPDRRFAGFAYAFAAGEPAPVSVTVTGRTTGAAGADLICRYGLTDADDTLAIRDLPLNVDAVTVNVTPVTLAGSS
jgi:hypothetical protein